MSAAQPALELREAEVAYSNGTRALQPTTLSFDDGGFTALEAEHANLVLVQDALEGLDDLAAGRVLNEDELDQALAGAAAQPRRPRKKG